MSRIRSMAVTLALVLTGLFASVGIAAAAPGDYPPSSVSPTSGSVAPTSGSVAPTSGTVAPTSSDVTTSTEAVAGVTSTVDDGSLAWTGAGFNLGATIAIALAVLVAGVGLVLVGGRMSRRGSSHS
ncbi:hypothetical protein GIS00_02095 [Nakamurella sp. YIM 132087]|uniref:LPXTG cell wall anchor domain-containing protein n=1 Tax=Nakamurella alba TaxID=2665158 RepID=A0A7K1FF85_9ACTN|nr:hypothetical protein [Nakamurella alba]MTD12736.1 hypothetical protein [Nakamurella alba]